MGKKLKKAEEKPRERPEEIKAKEALKQYFKELYKIEIKVVKGDEPPDYYVYINNEKISLEVTAVTKKIFNNGVEDVDKITNAIDKILHRLNSNLSNDVDINKTLLVSMYVPLINFTEFKNNIGNKISKFIHDNINEINSEEEFKKTIDICSNKLKIKAINKIEGTLVTSIKIPKYHSANADIGYQVRHTLSDRIGDKENKTKFINGVEWKGEKWLAIFNRYFLADKETYQRAMDDIEVLHSFNRIFIVDEDSSVYELELKSNKTRP